MATAKQFEDLGVWQDARELVNEIYEASRQPVFHRDFSLSEQFPRSEARQTLKWENLQPSTFNLEPAPTV